MANSLPNGDPHYEVYCSAEVAKSIHKVHQQASKQGRGPAMIEAFRQAV